MKAKKENKVYRITENDMQRYLNEGYDIYDEEGTLIKHSPLKKISYAEHEKEVLILKAEIEELKAQIGEDKKPPDKKAAKKEGE